MKHTQNTYPDLQHAFCARYRCSPDAFVKRAFKKGLPFHAWLLSPLLGGIRHPRYQHDLEALRSIGEAETMDDLNRALDELWSLQELNRDWISHLLGLQSSTVRLSAIFTPLIELVEPTTTPMPASTESMTLQTVTLDVRHRSTEFAPQRLRRVLRIHGAVTGGHDIDKILVQERISRRELEELLAEFAMLRAEVRWLQSYLRDRQELEKIRSVKLDLHSASAA
jgi:hypothetical protein